MTIWGCSSLVLVNNQVLNKIKIVIGVFSFPNSLLMKATNAYTKTHIAHYRISTRMYAPLFLIINTSGQGTALYSHENFMGLKP